MEEVDHWVAPPAKAITSMDQWKIEDMPGDYIKSKTGVAVDLKKKVRK
jgi:hypothetical protein